MNTIYKVGDKVKVRDDLSNASIYGGLDVVEEMEQLAGSVGEIVEVFVVHSVAHSSNSYEIIAYGISVDGNTYGYTSLMLEKYDEPVKEIDFKIFKKPSPNDIRFYLVEHVETGEEYVFLGESGLSLGRKVICDTSKGNQEGTILKEISLTSVITETHASFPLKWLVPKYV